MLTVFFFLILAACAVITLFAGKEPVSKKTIGARLATINTRVGDDGEHQIALAQKTRRRLSDRIGERFKSYHLGESLELLIIHAGSSMSVGQVLMFGAGIAIGCGIVTQWLAESPWVALAVAAITAFSPYLYLLFQKMRRLGKFNLALADAIDLMARALRAGHSMASSIEVIAQQSPEPLAGEFEICFQQQKFGIPFRDALLAMGERVPSDDLKFLITAVLVQKETGGDLTDILDRTTAVIRDRVRIEGEVSTRTAQGRLTGWILSALPIVLLILINIITPGYSTVLFHDPLGQMLLMAGGALILIGAFIISKIVDIKV
jgi:tight adherence protein B